MATCFNFLTSKALVRLQILAMVLILSHSANAQRVHNSNLDSSGLTQRKSVDQMLEPLTQDGVKEVVRISDCLVTSKATNLSKSRPKLSCPIFVSAGSIFEMDLLARLNLQNTYPNSLLKITPLTPNLRFNKAHRKHNNSKFVGSISFRIPNQPNQEENISLKLKIEIINKENERLIDSAQILQIPLRVFCTPQPPHLVFSNIGASTLTPNLIDSIIVKDLFEPIDPSLPNTAPRIVKDKVFYVEKNTAINTFSNSVQFENCTFYFDGYGGMKDNAFSQGNNINGAYNNYPCGLINGPLLLLNPKNGLLNFNQCVFQGGCNNKMWAGIKILSTPGPEMLEEENGQTFIVSPPPYFFDGITFSNSEFRDMYHGITDSLSLDLRPIDIQSSIKIENCNFFNNRIGIHIKGMPYSVNTDPSQSALSHLKTSIIGNNFICHPSQMKFPLNYDSSKPNVVVYKHYGLMGIYVDNRFAKNEFHQYIFENNNFENFDYGIRTRDSNGVATIPYKYTATITGGLIVSRLVYYYFRTLASNIVVSNSTFKNCRIAAISNYGMFSILQNTLRIDPYDFYPRTTVNNCSFVLEDIPDSAIRDFCDYPLNEQFRNPSGIYANGYLTVNNAPGDLGFINNRARLINNTIESKPKITGITMPNTPQPNNMLSDFNNLEVNGSYFQNFHRGIYHSLTGLVDIQNNTFKDNSVGIDLFLGEKDFYLGCNNFDISCTGNPLTYLNASDNDKPDTNRMCPVYAKTIGVRFSDEVCSSLKVKSNGVFNYISGKKDASYLKSQGINALPRGGNHWPNYYNWEGYADKEVLRLSGLRIPQMPAILKKDSPRAMIEAPYIQYVANADTSIIAPINNNLHSLNQVWRFNNPNWHAFYDDRYKTCPAVNRPFIQYLPYSNEFVDEKMCSQYSGTNAGALCRNLRNKLFLVYPDENSGIFKTTSNQNNNLYGMNSNEQVDSTPINSLYEFCDRIRSQLDLIYQGEFDWFTGYTDSCVNSLLTIGAYKFTRSGVRKPVRTIELGCAPKLNSVSWVPIPIYLRRQDLSFKQQRSLTLIYPNPTQYSVNITLSEYDPLKTYSISIVDLKGAQQGVYPITSQKTELNLVHLPAGIYALHLKSSDDSVSQRIKLAIVK